MYKRWLTLALFIAALGAPLVSGAPQAAPPAQGETLSLTLDECIARALQKNISLQAAVISPHLSEMSLKQAGEKYLPSFTFNYVNSESRNASYSWLDAATGNVVTLSGQYSGSVSQQIPLGGSVQLSLNSNKTDSTSRGQTINPRYQSTLSLNLTQPLLQGFGTKIANYNILVARNNFDISETQLTKTVQDMVYTVTSAYWQLVQSIENLKVQRLSLQLSKEFLAKNQLSVEIGTLSPLDLLSAQSEVASREASILAAEASVKNNEDNLKMLLSLTEEEEKGLAAILPVDKPKLEETKADLGQALTLAMQKRTDLRISQIGLKNQEMSLDYTKNQTLPNLSFIASYSSPGVSGTQILYDGNPLNGIVVGTVPGGASGALSDVFAFKYRNWSVRLNLNVPLSNLISKANLAQARLNMDQALLNLENQQKQVVLEIRNAVRLLETTYKQVQAYKTARELAERKLQAEEEKLRIGQSTNYFVLQYQRDLTNARISELAAIVSYNLAQVALDRSTGVILDKRNIKIADFLQH